MNTIIAANSPDILQHLVDGVERSDGALSHAANVSFDAIMEQLSNVPEDEQPLLFVELAGSIDEGKRLVESLSRSTNAKIVAIGSASSTRHVLEIIRSGAQDFLDKGDDLCKELRLLLSRVLSEDGDASASAKTITVTSCSGGCGGSSTAANIAACLAVDYGSCGLVDLQMRGGDLGALLNLTPRHTIADLLAKADTLELEMVTKALTKHECGIDFLASPELFASLSLARPNAVRQILEFMAVRRPFLVVEIEDVLHRDQIGTLYESDHVILVLRPDVPSIMRARKLLDFTLTCGVPESRIIFVGNRFPKRSQADELRKALAPHQVVLVPEDAKVMLDSVNFGRPVVLGTPDAPSAQAFRHLTNKIVGQLPSPAHESSQPRGLFRSVTRVFS